MPEPEDYTDPDCDMCQDSGKINLCWCAVTSPPCSGCTSLWQLGDEWRWCTDCDGESMNKKDKKQDTYISPFTGKKM